MDTGSRDNAGPITDRGCLRSALRCSTFLATPNHLVAEAPRSGLEEPAPSLSRGRSSTGKRGYELDQPSRRDASHRSLRHEAAGFGYCR
jgi:hypothetical protein